MKSLEKLALRVRWIWDEGKVVTCYAGDVIEELLHREGFEPQEETRLIAACKGKLLNIRMSFLFNEVENGSIIIINLKKTPLKSRGKLFLESLDNRNRPVHPAVVRQKRDSSIVTEAIRVSDLPFSSLECLKELPILLSDMLKAEEEWESSWHEKEGTIVTEKKELGNEPLPVVPFLRKEKVFFGNNCCTSLEIKQCSKYDNLCDENPE